MRLAHLRPVWPLTGQALRLAPACRTSRTAIHLTFNTPYLYLRYTYNTLLPSHRTHTPALPPTFPTPCARAKPSLAYSYTFPIRGDGYPIAGGLFCQLFVSSLEHGKQARRPGFNWIHGLAVCHEKDMVALGAIWEELFQVHFCALQRIFVRCCV